MYETENTKKIETHFCRLQENFPIFVFSFKLNYKWG
jgi:hypothetical protein